MEVINTHKKLLIVFSCIVVVCFLAIQSFYWWLDSPFIIPDRSIAYHSTTELIDLYWENKEELTQAAEAVLASEAFLQKIKEGYGGDEYIMFKSDIKYFSEDDWEIIVNVFKTFRPYTITRSLSDGYDVVYISFGERIEDGTLMDHGLFYFKNPEAAKDYESYIWVGELEHIDGCWYVD